MSNRSEIQLGLSVNIKKGKITTQSDFKRKGYLPLINTEALVGDAKLFANPKEGITCDSTDVLMLWDGERSGLVATGQVGVVGSTFARLRPDPSIDSKYLFYFLQDRYQWLQNNRTGTGVPHVAKDIGRILIIKYPIYTLQQKIAKILSTIDGQIEKTEAIIAKYQAVKQGMLQDLFTRGIDASTGELRPKYEDAPGLYKESVLGMVPREWEVEQVAELIKKNVLDDIQDGNHGEAHPKSSDFVHVGIPFIMASNISDDKIDFANCYKISTKQYRQLRIGFSKAGDILLSHKASIGFVARVPLDIKEVMLTPQVTYYRVLNENILKPDYLEYFFRSSTFQTPLHNLAKQSTRDYIGITMQKSLKVAYPNNTVEQQLISERLMAAYSNHGIERKHLLKLQKIKQGLMSDLLSGKVEVTV